MTTDVYRCLNDVFGFADFRDGQEEVISCLLGQRNLLAVMPTGAGKSLCYQLPALLLEGRTIVVSPLIALMNDQVAFLQSLNVPAEQINSHAERDANVRAWERFVSGETKILYLSPERLMSGRMVEALQALPMALFVVDEAHCISKWGSGFRPDYESLAQLQQHFPDAVIAAFTATADKATRADVVEKLCSGNAQTFVRGFDRPNLSLEVQPKSGWKESLLTFLEEKRGATGIIYTLSRRETESLAAFLQQNNFEAIAYHGGQETQARRDAQDRFMTEQAIVMVATIAFGMGIDKPDIRFVVHANLPSSMEAFYQEIGRAGRDGEPADTLLFFGMEDFMKRSRMIQAGTEPDDHKRRELKRLNALLGYCETALCRKQALLGYFDEDDAPPCKNCDNCRNPPTRIDRSDDVRLLLAAIQATGQMFGSGYVVSVLRGDASDPRIAKKGHDRAPVFGKGAAHPKPFWHSLIRQLSVAGKIKIGTEYGVLSVTAAGKAIAQGEEQFFAKQVTAPKSKPQARTLATTTHAAPAKSAPSAPPNPEDESLLAALKAKRLEIARAKDCPAYIIFADRTLKDMTAKRPQTEDDFLKVDGVGPHKAEAYSGIFLAIIREHS